MDDLSWLFENLWNIGDAWEHVLSFQSLEELSKARLTSKHFVDNSSSQFPFPANIWEKFIRKGTIHVHVNARIATLPLAIKYMEKLHGYNFQSFAHICTITKIIVGAGTYEIPTHPPSEEESEQGVGSWPGNNNCLEIKNSVIITGQGSNNTTIIGGFIIKNEESKESGGTATTHLTVKGVLLEGSLRSAVDARAGTSFDFNEAVACRCKNFAINAVEGVVGTIESSQIFDCCKGGVCVEGNGKITIKGNTKVFRNNTKKYDQHKDLWENENYDDYGLDVVDPESTIHIVAPLSLKKVTVNNHPIPNPANQRNFGGSGKINIVDSEGGITETINLPNINIDGSPRTEDEE